jgi:nicotinate phosphoribosyltransferase
LAAFIAYACAFPDNCLCLIDTYDTLSSGLPNFIAVAKALDDFGYIPKGIRLDSGNLAALSLACQTAFRSVVVDRACFAHLTIVVSNDINEKVLHTLTTQEHGITAFGIGTNLVTCQAQPALGCVYKLVEWKGKPRIKLSQSLGKVTIPGRKRVFRLIGKTTTTTTTTTARPPPPPPLVDYMCLASEAPPQVGARIECRHPFDPQKSKIVVIPSQVVALHSVVFENGTASPIASLEATRSYVQEQLQSFSSKTDTTRYENPQSYDVLVSTALFRFLYDLWEQEAPVEERS